VWQPIAVADLPSGITMSKLASYPFVNADIAAAAAIAASKLAGYPSNTTTFLRGDGTWAAPPAGGGTWTLSTTAPSSPATGDHWIYPYDVTNGIYWEFIYDAAQATYKWVWVGGTPFIYEGDANVAFSSLTQFGSTGYGWVGAALTTPRAGDWLVEAVASIMNSGGTGQAHNVAVAGGAAIDASSLQSLQVPPSSSVVEFTVKGRITNLAASSVVGMGCGPNTYTKGWQRMTTCWIRPIRW
jgi:hypothetical protein